MEYTVTESADPISAAIIGNPTDFDAAVKLAREHRDATGCKTTVWHPRGGGRMVVFWGRCAFDPTPGEQWYV